MKVLVSDIAKKAGVSSGTVSNALNDRKGISQRKKEMILQIANEMGYFEQREKIETKDKKIKFILLNNHGNVVGDTPFFSELIRGIEAESRILGYELIINYIDMNSNKDFSNIFNDEGNGFLVLGTELNESDLEKFVSVNRPFVFLDTSFRTSDYDFVAINNFDSVFKIVELMYKYGHRNIGIINSSFQMNNFRERKKGFIQALSDFELVFSEENELKVLPDFEGSYTGMKSFLQNSLSNNATIPTAFFSVNDNIAFGALRAINEMNQQDKISIVGFDDLPLAEFCIPPLTTVRVDKANLGKEAIQRLHYKINNIIGPSVKILQQTNIIERESLKKI